MSQSEANYSEFPQLPDNWTRAIWSAAETDSFGDKRLVNESDPFKWSGKVDPPAIGQEVHCYMNGLGRGLVVGYFVEYGWLGVMVQLAKNPAWRRKQNGGKNPPAHLFGVDLEPRPRVPTLEAAARKVIDGNW